MTLDGAVHITIGPYRIVQKIGEGGMGEVYEAFHDTIQRRVAVKVLHAAKASDEEFTSRFMNEARAVNLVNHPGLVQVSDLGQLPNGSFYLVMELLQGEMLSSRLKRSQGKLTLPEALEFGWQIADSLAAAHAKNILHRDLKPQNVMLVPDSHVSLGERAKLLDFGLAKVSEEAGGVEVLTQSNMLIGTPLYMSPEQCAGTGGIDDKTDVYSLGVMLYEMLCGKQPFTGRGAGLVMAMHITQTPEPLHNLVPMIPVPAADLIHRMLAKRKDERPTMLQVAAELDTLRTLFPAQVRRSSISSLPAIERSIDPLEATRTFTQLVNQNTTLPAAAAEMREQAPRRRLMAAGALGMLLGVLGVGALMVGEHRLEMQAGQQARSAAAPSAEHSKIELRADSEPPPQPLNADSGEREITCSPRRLKSHKEHGTGSLHKGQAVARAHSHSPRHAHTHRHHDY